MRNVMPTVCTLAWKNACASTLSSFVLMEVLRPFAMSTPLESVELQWLQQHCHWLQQHCHCKQQRCHWLQQHCHWLHPDPGPTLPAPPARAQWHYRPKLLLHTSLLRWHGLLHSIGMAIG